MAVDAAQTRIDERVRAVGPAARMRLHDRLHGEAIALLWAQADHAGPMTEVERARFLLRRLYPELEGPRLDAIIDRLDAEWRAGTWTGFRRADPLPGETD